MDGLVEWGGVRWVGGVGGSWQAASDKQQAAKHKLFFCNGPVVLSHRFAAVQLPRQPYRVNMGS